MDNKLVLSNTDSKYRQCKISVMDNIADPDITFDENGICNYYHEYNEIEKLNVFKGENGEKKLNELINNIKLNGKNLKYDCITGISGGVDSSYLVWKAKEWGLRPLIVHFDNGWNSEIAVENINNIIKKTGFDLYTIVVDWDEFKDLQLSYLKASVVDIEVPTDHAIGGTLYKLALKYGIKYILSGNNVVTEAILPSTWTFNKSDYVNLTNIHKQFGTQPLKTYPLFDFKEQLKSVTLKKIVTVKPLNYISYSKSEAKKVIIEKLNWKDYGGKHYESVFTKFYQAYILPSKFKIDKRKAHLSTLIFSGQISKQEALKELEAPLYEATEFENEYEYVIKKFGLTKEAFDTLMKKPIVTHQQFGHQEIITEKYLVIRSLKKMYKFFFRR